MSKIRVNPFFPNDLKSLSNALGVYWRELATTINALVDTMSIYDSNDFALAVSRGLITGRESLRKFGRNNAVGSSSELISMTGASVPYTPTSAVNVEVVTTGNDTSAGSGAREVTVVGLDGNFAELTEAVATNAGTATTTNTFIRVFRAYVSSVGTYGGSNENNIIIRAATAGTTFVTIVAGAGQTETSHYCTPAGKSLYIRDVHLTVDSGKAAGIVFKQRQNADDVSSPYSATRSVQTYSGVVNTTDFEYFPYLKFPAKTDIWFTGTCATSAEISIEYSGILVTE